jgi:S1-C subfamily serine protease
MKTVLGFLIAAACVAAAPPARAQESQEELKRKILQDIEKKLDEGIKKILEEVSQYLDRELAKLKGGKSTEPAPSGGKRGFLGVEVDPEQPEEADFKAWKVEGGVRINPIEGGPAATAGMQEGDVIFEADGKKVREWAELPEIIGARKGGDKIKIKYVRGKEQKEATVTLGIRDDSGGPGGATPPPAADPPAQPGRIGITPGEATGKGLSIESVNPDLPAAKAGIKAGDILTKLDDTPIWKESDLEKFMPKTKPGQKVEVTVLRDGAEKKFSVVLAGR